MEIYIGLAVLMFVGFSLTFFGHMIFRSSSPGSGGAVAGRMTLEFGAIIFVIALIMLTVKGFLLYGGFMVLPFLN